MKEFTYSPVYAQKYNNVTDFNVYLARKYKSALYGYLEGKCDKPIVTDKIQSAIIDNDEVFNQI
jgi:hypothetical protein